jgi:hypothetical protein
MVQIARDNLALALEYHKKVSTLCDALKNLEGYEAEYFLSEKLSPIENKLNNHCLVALVFAALAVEGYIYDYAARKLTDNFVESHLDKLDVVSKWVVIPKLVTRKDFPKDKQAFSLLKQLVQNRNYLAHNKSVKLMKADVEPNLTVNGTSENLTEMLYSDSAKRMLKFGDSILDKAKDAIKTLDELAIVMESLDPDEITSGAFHSPVGRAKEQYTETGIWPWGEEEES